MAKSAVHGAPKVRHSCLSSVTEVARLWLQAGLGGHSQQGFKRLRRCSGARLSVGGGGMRDRAPGAEFLRAHGAPGWGRLQLLARRPGKSETVRPGGVCTGRQSHRTWCRDARSTRHARSGRPEHVPNPGTRFRLQIGSVCGAVTRAMTCRVPRTRPRRGAVTPGAVHSSVFVKYLAVIREQSALWRWKDVVEAVCWGFW